MNRKWWLFVDAILLGVILAHALPAFAQALPTVTPDTNWLGIGIAVVCVFVIAGGIWYMRDRPGAVAKAKEETAGSFEAIAHRLTESLSKLTDTNAEAVATIPVALAATPPGSVPAGSAMAQSAGKAGTPGVFVIAVTGDPNADLPAINAQYFG